MVETDRRAIFDIYCESDNGDKFIVEMQKAKQNFFKDRSVFYSTFPIREQAETGNWDFELKAVYCVALLDFIFDEYPPEPEFVHTVQLRKANCRLFYDKLTFIFLEMPKFDKQESELHTHFDKWLYFIKNLEKFDTIPAPLRNRVFEKAFRTAEIAQFNQAQMQAYEDSLKHFRDMNNVINTAVAEAVAQATAEVTAQVTAEVTAQVTARTASELNTTLARQMKQDGEPIAKIMRYTHLSQAQIEAL